MLARARVLIILVVAVLCASATRASAQGAGGIAGVVRDPSGAVMPGVTVEASSAALIEKVRSVVTDADGQYKIIDLRPGTYTVTFTLPGFSTVKREGIELSANFTAAVNADLRVGGLEETITVSGQAPMVDTQNVVQQKVVTQELLAVGPGQPQQLRGADTRGLTFDRRRRQQRQRFRRDLQHPRLAQRRRASPDRRHAVEFDGSRQRRHRLLLRPDRRRRDRHSARRQLGGVRARRRSGESRFRRPAPTASAAMGSRATRTTA